LSLRFRCRHFRAPPPLPTRRSSDLQLRFPTILAIGAQEPAAFQEAVRRDFPQYAARQEQLPPKVVRKGNTASLEAQKPITNYNFISQDGRWKLNLTQNFIALSRPEEHTSELQSRFD